jgi:hypothetical protein
MISINRDERETMVRQMSYDLVDILMDDLEWADEEQVYDAAHAFYEELWKISWSHETVITGATYKEP